MRVFQTLPLPWQGGRHCSMQLVTDPTLDLCIRLNFQLGGQRQWGIRRLPNNSTCDQHWESNPKPCDLEQTLYPLGHVFLQ